MVILSSARAILFSLLHFDYIVPSSPGSRDCFFRFLNQNSHGKPREPGFFVVFNSLSSLQRLPNSFWRCGILVHIDADRVEDRVADGRRNAIHRDLSHSFNPERMTWLERFHKDGLEGGHFVGAEDMITIQVTFDGIAFFIITHFFADSVPQSLSHAAF